ncbi:MAG TPA: AMP-binding protein [Planctomycetota bacterium]|jgi:fatty-acyl-CoA synthase
MNPHDTPCTLIDALSLTAAKAPSTGITVFDRRGQNGERRSYSQLLASAQHAAGLLAAAGIAPGDRVLFCLNTSWDLLEAYFGALLRGACPVLIAPSGALGGAATHAQKLSTFVELLGARRLICDETTRKELADFGASAAHVALTPPELRALNAPAGLTPPPEAAPGDIAFMQLTSGSTGRQRAVQIRHSNVLANIHALAAFTHSVPFSGNQRIVSWLPLNHDMGLVGCLLFSIVNGFELFLLRPDSFLARPRLWLQTISAGRGTLTPAPNFAYQLCCDRLTDQDLAGLDLSGCRALTGAEMVQPQTCRAFSEKMSAYGMRPEMLMPSYGMAETTLGITADVRGRGVRTLPIPGADKSAGDVVCVGAPVEHTEVRISSPSEPGRFLPEQQIGEVWVNGPSVFAGYYNDPEASADALPTVAGRVWLRTGDLGFMHDDELYITGRIKDLLIIHGHNLMPHELEWLAEGVTGGGGTERCGAFSVPGGAQGEQAVVVVEVAGTKAAALPALAHEIRTRVGKVLGLPLSDVVFVKRGQIPKTTSGKVQRRQLRQRFLEGKLERLG